jgi:hypothetical protein
VVERFCPAELAVFGGESWWIFGILNRNRFSGRRDFRAVQSPQLNMLEEFALIQESL